MSTKRITDRLSILPSVSKIFEKGVIVIDGVDLSACMLIANCFSNQKPRVTIGSNKAHG